VGWPPAEFATRLYTRCLDDVAASGVGIPLPSPRTLACILTRAARTCAGCGEADGGALKSCSLCRSFWYCGTECQASHWRASHRVACTRTRSIPPSEGAMRLVMSALNIHAGGMLATGWRLELRKWACAVPERGEDLKWSGGHLKAAPFGIGAAGIQVPGGVTPGPVIISLDTHGCNTAAAAATAAGP
jgi:hypothetical protein